MSKSLPFSNCQHQKMFTIKLFVLVTFVEVILATNVGQLLFRSKRSRTIQETLQLPYVIHRSFLGKNDVKPTDNFRYGYEIHDPNKRMTTRHYEMRYNDVNLGIDNTFQTNERGRSTVNYTIDATKGYRSIFSAESLEHTTLDYKHFPSPLVSATPPNDAKMEAFKSFPIDDQENIDKHSPDAQSAYKARNNFNEFFYIMPNDTAQYSWGYEIAGRTSQYETRHADHTEGRITLVNTNGCVSTMYYTVDANHFNVSTVRTFGKQDIPQLYLNPQYYPLLLQIALGPSKCD